MNDLDMCMAIAKLEGIDVSKDRHFKCLYLPCSIDLYDPIEDISLNAELCYKHKVNFDYYFNLSDSGKQISCCNLSIDGKHYVVVDNITIEKVRRGAVKCILKASGLYK